MLVAHGPGLWSLAQPHRVAGFELGRRVTVVRLDSGGLMLLSPIPISDAERAAIAVLGNVTHLVAPNLWHYRFLPEAKRLFPAARVLLVPGLREKRPELPFDAVLTEVAAEHAPLVPIAIEGMPTLGEVVFLHPPSRTLVVTDLAAHLTSSDHWPTRWYLKASRAYGTLAQTLLLRSLVRDRAALRRSVDALLALDFDRIVLPHRDVVESGGREALRSAFARL